MWIPYGIQGEGKVLLETRPSNTNGGERGGHGRCSIKGGGGGEVSIVSTAMEALSCVGANHTDDGGSRAGLQQQCREWWESHQ